MRLIDWNKADEADRRAVLTRPSEKRNEAVSARVREIISDVRNRGAEAVDDWSRRLDGVPVRRLELTRGVVARARDDVAPEDQAALRMAAQSVRAFHEADRPTDGAEVTTPSGATSQRCWRALDSVGLYVPAGTAPLFSTLLMLAIPAQVAGVRNRVVVTPPGPGGEVHPMMVLAADEAGLEDIWVVGGCQAIAALALGAGTPRVDKIFGPGNAWVAEAKRQVAELPDGPAMDLPAGPSELMVIADEGASPEVVAADLLGQAEHDADAQVLLVTPSVELARAAALATERRLVDLPRAEIAQQSLASGAVVLVQDLDQAVELANLYGPEHLSLQTRDADALLVGINNVGAIFAGDGAAETFGDYLAGPSHVLPTSGAARVHSGISTASFMKSISVQRVSRRALPQLVEAAARLARLEGLEAHARAAEARLEAERP